MKAYKLLLTAILGLFLAACGSDSSTAPGAPTNVKVVAGTSVGSTASVSFSAPAFNGGSSITGYTVTTSPGGITATAASSPIPLAGLTPGTSYTISVVATNSAGNSPAATVKNINNYNVVETFYEPSYHSGNMMGYTGPIKDTIFTGTFTYDSVSQIVSNLKGSLTEAMTAFPMVTVALNNQLSSVPATLGGVDGILVTTFKNSITDTLLGGDGWSPANGVTNGGVYYGGPGGTNPGNAYAMIFVNKTDPTAALVQAQIDKLAYADCTPTAPPGGMMGMLAGGGMMGSACMTGTTVAGYGDVGTMAGYPLSQVITKQ